MKIVNLIYFYWFLLSAEVAVAPSSQSNLIVCKLSHQTPACSNAKFDASTTFTKTVNVKNFGAKGDGKTNDTDAFERALAAVPKNGILYIPKGTYRTILSIRRNAITISGDSSSTTILKTPDSIDASSVLELGNLAAGNDAEEYSAINVSGLTLNGNSTKVPAPLDDLHGWGMSATKVSNSIFKDIIAQDCGSGGIGFFINSNHNSGTFEVRNSGFRNKYAQEPGFDINSSKFNNFRVISKNCAYGMRILDNCVSNTINVEIVNAEKTGLIISNQLVNVSYSNSITAIIKKGCSDQGVHIGANVFNNTFKFFVDEVTGVGINEYGPGEKSSNDKLRPHDNKYEVSTNHSGNLGVLVGGNNSNWIISSSGDGRKTKKGDVFAIDVYGNKNNFTVDIKDSLPSKIRGIAFRKSSNSNKLLTFTHQNIMQPIFDQGQKNRLR